MLMQTYAASKWGVEGGVEICRDREGRKEGKLAEQENGLGERRGKCV